MRIAIAAASSTVLLAIAACGGPSMMPGATQGTADVTAITAYEGLTTHVQSAADSYGAAMGAPGMTLAGCSAVHDAYDAQVRPWLSQMMQASGTMDAYMDAHGGGAYADMGCVANAMLSELDAHRAAACTFATLSDDQAEVTRHVGVMGTYGSHLTARCGTMMGGASGHGYMWGPIATGCGSTGSTDPVAPGQRIFGSGIGASGQAIARTGGSGMMSSGGCASCHGLDGHGRTTMMFTSPNVTYANLADPSGMLDPDGSRGPTYTDELIRRAVVEGAGADGQALSTVMPRWQLGDQDWADLLAYLKTLP